MPESVLKAIGNIRDPIILALLVTTVVVVFALIAALTRIGKLNRQYARLTRNTSGGNLEEVLFGYMDTVNGVVGRIEALETRAAQLEAGHARCLQRIGIVRFDAFEEVGGEQSFAVV